MKRRRREALRPSGPITGRSRRGRKRATEQVRLADSKNAEDSASDEQDAERLAAYERAEISRRSGPPVRDQLSSRRGRSEHTRSIALSQTRRSPSAAAAKVKKIPDDTRNARHAICGPASRACAIVGTGCFEAL